MLVVVALGGNALLQRGQAMTIEVQRGNISKAAQALAPMARRHHLVLSHGNGPQVGLLALQQTAYKTVEPYPFDVLDAQTEGMIGYMIEQELGNLLASEVPLATLLTMVEVDSKDLSFRNPTKFIGGQYDEVDAKKMIEAKGWAFKKDGDKWRRVVPSPKPKRIYEIRPIKWLLEKGTIVICAGGGGIPIVCEPSEERCMKGIEAVIDKDLASGLLARELKADLFMMVTDVPGVYLNFNKPEAVLLRYTTPSELRRNMYQFPDGSMGPKVQAACEFVEATGNPAAIGALPEINEILNRAAGTIVELDK